MAFGFQGLFRVIICSDGRGGARGAAMRGILASSISVQRIDIAGWYTPDVVMRVQGGGGSGGSGRRRDDAGCLFLHQEVV